jgi:hypothetical protein
MEIRRCGALKSRARRFFARCNFAILKTLEKKKKRPQVAEKAGTVFAGEMVERLPGAHKKEDARKGTADLRGWKAKEEVEGCSGRGKTRDGAVAQPAPAHAAAEYRDCGADVRDRGRA